MPPPRGIVGDGGAAHPTAGGEPIFETVEVQAGEPVGGDSGVGADPEGDLAPHRQRERQKSCGT
jgi:hypothetical protein